MRFEDDKNGVIKKRRIVGKTNRKKSTYHLRDINISVDKYF